MRDYTQSAALLSRLRAATPGGSQTMSKAATRFCEGAYPVAISRMDGPWVWDVDGHRYLDLICGLGAWTLGHHNPAVDAAVLGQWASGPIFSLPSPLEAEVSEKFCAAIPCARDGMVRWTKTGSEACAAAVRIARRYTEKDIIITVAEGYHGWHDWFTVLKPSHPGIPEFYRDGVERFKFNDLESLERALYIHRGNVAAVMLEPMLLTPPDPDFLQGVVDIAHLHHALAIFDEMVTGFRWARAGGQEYFGVTPDLATFGKGLGNGLPIACVCGRREVMSFGDVISGTFGGDALALAAAGAVLDVYATSDPCGSMWAFGRVLIDTVTSLACESGLPLQWRGWPPHPQVIFRSSDGDVHDRLLLSLLVQELAEAGVLIHPAGFNIPAFLTAEQQMFVLSAWAQALEVVARHLHDPAKGLRGAVYEDAKVRS